MSETWLAGARFKLIALLKYKPDLTKFVSVQAVVHERSLFHDEGMREVIKKRQPPIN